jgi:hypothetical protein
LPFKGLPETHTAMIHGNVALGFLLFAAVGDLIQGGRMRGAGALERAGSKPARHRRNRADARREDAF